jgi:hypothetical protein
MCGGGSAPPDFANDVSGAAPQHWIANECVVLHPGEILGGGVMAIAFAVFHRLALALTAAKMKLPSTAFEKHLLRPVPQRLDL